jgi:hypothetical protein
MFAFTILYVGVFVGTIMKNFELKVRLTQYEALQLKQEALRRNMTKSELIRSLIARFPDPLLEKDSQN